MRIKTLEDCLKASMRIKKKLEIDVAASLIARAFHLLTEKELALRANLKSAATQEERWKIYQDAPSGSRIVEEALTDFLLHATTQKERWEVYKSAPGWSEVEMAALDAFLANATTKDERWEAYDAESKARGYKKAAEAILANAVTIEDWKDIYNVSHSESDLEEKAVYALCTMIR